MMNVKGLSKRERSAVTRRSIVQAAAQEFTASGYHGATMASISRRAGVATQTVYFVFHTKTALLTAAIDAAVMGDEELPPERSAWWGEATTTGHGRRAIELFVDGTVDILVRAAPLSRVAQSAAGSDTEVLELIHHHEQLRVDGYRAFVDTLHARGFLKAGLTPEEATDVLLTLVGANVFLDLTQDRGWDISRYARWAGRALGLLLLPPG